MAPPLLPWTPSSLYPQIPPPRLPPLLPPRPLPLPLPLLLLVHLLRSPFSIPSSPSRTQSWHPSVAFPLPLPLNSTSSIASTTCPPSYLSTPLLLPPPSPPPMSAPPLPFRHRAPFAWSRHRSHSRRPKLIQHHTSYRPSLVWLLPLHHRLHPPLRPLHSRPYPRLRGRLGRGVGPRAGGGGAAVGRRSGGGGGRRHRKWERKWREDTSGRVRGGWRLPGAGGRGRRDGRRSGRRANGGGQGGRSEARGHQAGHHRPVHAAGGFLSGRPSAVHLQVESTLAPSTLSRRREGREGRWTTPSGSCCRGRGSSRLLPPPRTPLLTESPLSEPRRSRRRRPRWPWPPPL